MFDDSDDNTDTENQIRPAPQVKPLVKKNISPRQEKRDTR